MASKLDTYFHAINELFVNRKGRMTKLNYGCRSTLATRRPELNNLKNIFIMQYHPKSLNLKMRVDNSILHNLAKEFRLWILEKGFEGPHSRLKLLTRLRIRLMDSKKLWARWSAKLFTDSLFNAYHNKYSDQMVKGRWR